MSAAYANTGGHWVPCSRPDEAAWRLAVVLRDNFACAYCRLDLHDAAPKVVTLDHLTPNSQGGSHQSSNIVTACRPCNSSRKDRPWRTFAAERGADVASIQRNRRRKLNLPLARAFLQGAVS